MKDAKNSTLYLLKNQGAKANSSKTTMPTGGFSTRSRSMAHCDSADGDYETWPDLALGGSKSMV